ncbi:hypothetical protein [Nocardia sp. NPDC056100]|uniref:hypothetical protein n=1 Tax=Nocardia sp. NPDC056100 TaxID=3345712 RepID=UPI0035D7186B
MGDDPHVIRLRVQGRLGPIALSAFPTMTAIHQDACTVLTGQLPDRAALFGLLVDIENLGLDIVEMRTHRVRAADPTVSDNPGRP